MKTKILCLGLLIVSLSMKGQQWTSTGNNVTTGLVGVKNPYNVSASAFFAWQNNTARFRVGGTGVGAGNGFDFQGPGDVSLLRLKGNGNIGVGTNNPGARLHVYGGDFLVDFASNYGNKPRIEFKTNGGADTSQNFYRWTGVNQDYRATRLYRGQNSFNIQMASDSNMGSHSFIDVLVINNNGRVGIGTIDTGEHKLAVEGSIGAREIKVEAFPNWSDFVFEKAYKLPSLEDVEKHILEKGHLYDIPSAKEVYEEGFFLGEMDSKLLQKIEELTLYTIEQEKEIKLLKAQGSRIEKLEIQNNLLLERLEHLEKMK